MYKPKCPAAIGASGGAVYRDLVLSKLVTLGYPPGPSSTHKHEFAYVVCYQTRDLYRYGTI